MCFSSLIGLVLLLTFHYLYLYLLAKTVKHGTWIWLLTGRISFLRYWAPVKLYELEMLGNTESKVTNMEVPEYGLIHLILSFSIWKKNTDYSWNLI